MSLSYCKCNVNDILSIHPIIITFYFVNNIFQQLSRVDDFSLTNLSLSLSSPLNIQRHVKLLISHTCIFFLSKNNCPPRNFSLSDIFRLDSNNLSVDSSKETAKSIGKRIRGEAPSEISQAIFHVRRSSLGISRREMGTHSSIPEYHLTRMDIFIVSAAIFYLAGRKKEKRKKRRERVTGLRFFFLSSFFRRKFQTTRRKENFSIACAALRHAGSVVTEHKSTALPPLSLFSSFVRSFVAVKNAPVLQGNWTFRFWNWKKV